MNARPAPVLTPCGIALCPALTSRQFCEFHEHARRAVELGLSAGFDGRGAQSCIVCRKRFAPADWVDRLRRTKPYRTAKNAPKTGYAHMSCEPAPPKTRRAKGPAETPLFVGID